MMYLTKEGFLYRAVPNMLPKKDERGNRYEVQDGFKPDGIPLMKVILFDSPRANPALDALRATGQLVEE